MQQGTDFVKPQPRRPRLGYLTEFRRQGTRAVLVMALLSIGCIGFVVLPLLLREGSDGLPARDGSSRKILVLGERQEMMVQMLDRSLPFTVFLPSDTALSKVLKSTIDALASDGKVESTGALPDVNDTVTQDVSNAGAANASQKSLKGSRLPLSVNKGFASRAAEEFDAINAVISRLLAFGAIPSRILADGTPSGSETRWESISGYIVYVARDSARGFLANNMSCQATDIIRGSTVIHILEGALMDPEFEQAVTVENEEV